jgi:hypothetical protein
MDFPPRSLHGLTPGDLFPPAASQTVYHNPPAQQTYELHGFGTTFSFHPPTQYPGGQLAVTQNHAQLHPSSLFTVLPSPVPHHSESAGNTQSEYAAPAGSTSLMDPPARPRKRKAPTLRANDWEPYKERILQLHVEEELPLPKVMQLIEEEYSFKAE